MIKAFRGQYTFLSNFHPCQIHVFGETFKSAEHAYMWCKSTSPAYRKSIQAAHTPGEAKRLGRQITLRADWDTIKYAFMREILTAKFIQNKDLGRLLERTGAENLVEVNHWHDNIWGECSCPKCCDKGENMLGIILMDIRESRR